MYIYPCRVKGRIGKEYILRVLKTYKKDKTHAVCTVQTSLINVFNIDEFTYLPEINQSSIKTIYN